MKYLILTVALIMSGCISSAQKNAFLLMRKCEIKCNSEKANVFKLCLGTYSGMCVCDNVSMHKVRIE
jgi:hypothetical protein